MQILKTVQRGTFCISTALHREGAGLFLIPYKWKSLLFHRFLAAGFNEFLLKGGFFLLRC